MSIFNLTRPLGGSVLLRMHRSVGTAATCSALKGLVLSHRAGTLLPLERAGRFQ